MQKLAVFSAALLACVLANVCPAPCSDFPADPAISAQTNPGSNPAQGVFSSPAPQTDNSQQLGQAGSGPDASRKPAKHASAEKGETLPRFGIGIKFSSLGAGIEVATPLSRQINVRMGFNAFNYNPSFNQNGITYGGQLSFRSAETHLDWFPRAGGFHISPGVLYNGNRLRAIASVPGGQTFTMNNTTYYSDPSNPVNGTGALAMNKIAPSLMIGWGNLLPRGSKHFTFPFEIGVAYVGSPRVSLNLNGRACDSTGLFCSNVNSDPTIQSNVQAEQTKINKDASPYKFYPVISTGFGYRF